MQRQRDRKVGPPAFSHRLNPFSHRVNPRVSYSEQSWFLALASSQIYWTITLCLYPYFWNTKWPSTALLNVLSSPPRGWACYFAFMLAKPHRLSKHMGILILISLQALWTSARTSPVVPLMSPLPSLAILEYLLLWWWLKGPLLHAWRQLWKTSLALLWALMILSRQMRSNWLRKGKATCECTCN